MTFGKRNLRRRGILKGVGLGLFLGLLLTFTVVDLGYSQGSREMGVLPEYHPKKFSGTGGIDRIASNEIVIDDSLYKLSPRVTYRTPRIANASSAWFRQGDYVGFLTGSGGEIISLWLIE